MVVTTHAVYGLLASKNLTENSKQAFLIGAGSHIILDKIPHRDYAFRAHKGLFLWLDLLLAHFLIKRYAEKTSDAVGAISGYGVDPVVLLSRRFKKTIPLANWHDKSHTKINLSVKTGFVSQLGFILAACLFMEKILRQTHKTGF